MEGRELGNRDHVSNVTTVEGKEFMLQTAVEERDTSGSKSQYSLLRG